MSQYDILRLIDRAFLRQWLLPLSVYNKYALTVNVLCPVKKALNI